jgi:hypothetical protein
MKNLFYIYLVLILFQCCTNQENKKFSSQDLEFKHEIIDSISKYLFANDSACDLIISLSTSFVMKTIRLNIYTPTDTNSFYERGMLKTQINGRNAYIKSGLDEIVLNEQKKFSNKNGIIENEPLEKWWQIHRNCSGQIFVLYDSIGIITVINNLNDFDDDLRPHHQLDLNSILY